jgi:carbonic anhydrase
LIAGLGRFQRDVYPRLKSTYERLAQEGQRPHTLFITCADSRIDPELITQSKPGEIFVSRNIGNLVPSYGEMAGSVSAIIEYAVSGLEVSQVVICGHTHCGAMAGLLHPEKVESLPTVQTWLRNGHAALSVIRSRAIADEHQLLNALIEENVLLQLRHLRTHPSVSGRLADGSLALAGWVYDIRSGVVRVYDDSHRGFVLPQTTLTEEPCLR